MRRGTADAPHPRPLASTPGLSTLHAHPKTPESRRIPTRSGRASRESGRGPARGSSTRTDRYRKWSQRSSRTVSPPGLRNDRRPRRRIIQREIDFEPPPRLKGDRQRHRGQRSLAAIRHREARDLAAARVSDLELRCDGALVNRRADLDRGLHLGLRGPKLDDLAVVRIRDAEAGVDAMRRTPLLDVPAHEIGERGKESRPRPWRQTHAACGAFTLIGPGEIEQRLELTKVVIGRRWNQSHDGLRLVARDGAANQLEHVLALLLPETRLRLLD